MTNAPLHTVHLDDKYDLTKKRVFLTGTQAVVRLMMMQQERDKRAGLNTGGFVSGYRGSPLGGLDQQFIRARKLLEPRNIVFKPGLNEELAATALWGSQQATMRGEGAVDGVFGVWYGKGPGVDRCSDVFRHANLAGTDRHGGVIAMMGDDHTAESSTTAHQSEFSFVDVMIPILNPAGVQEILDYGLYGFAMSRYCGSWTAMKLVKDNVESTASVDGSLDRVKIIIPGDDEFQMPQGGLNIRASDVVAMLEQEARLQEYKRDAMLAFIRANKINHLVTHGGKNPRIGIITTGKSYLDLRQAWDDLGIDEVRANDLGIRVYKVGCPWPLSRRELMEFATGLDMIMVVEEKRSLIEVQVREELYGTGVEPIVVGKKDEQGQWLFPVKGALDPNDIGVALGERILKYTPSNEIAARVDKLRQAQKRLAETQDAAQRTPYFCSGCPHNTSTKIPEGSRAYAGIGCHFMVQWMDRDTVGFTAMGGEGANWVGEQWFSKRGHIFQNLGDGTYSHSGSLAIRFAIASGANMTYKILFNDAVAMTGGQALDNNLTPQMIANQIAAEGVKKIAVVTDEPWKYDGSHGSFPTGVTVHHRDELIAVQKELAETKGVTAMIYDQTCAAEKRRRRKRGEFPDPDKRVIINELVCEGCGDCGVQSNCVSVQPLDTEFGRKRQIDQSNCNKDFSCVKGFCPSFVTVHGAKVKKAEVKRADVGGLASIELPEPVIPELSHQPFGVIVTGVGGTGVVTVGAILGMAAHLEGKGLGMIDMAGLAQKGGAVYSYVKLAASPDDIHAIRIGAGHADLVLGCDLVVSGTKKVLAGVKQGETAVFVNTAEIMPGDFTRKADFSLPAERVKRAIIAAAGEQNVEMIDATSIATGILGNAIAANMFLLGLAYQSGKVPLTGEAIEKAIELNGEAVKMNLEAFRWGRRAAVDRAAIEALVEPLKAPTKARHLSQSLDEIIARRVEFLNAYQNAAYAERYRALVEKVRAAEKSRAPGKSGLTDAVARYLFKLMAIKDEYEVARLYTDGAFMKQLNATFEGDMRFEFHLAPPLLSRPDPTTGLPRKMSFGPWMMKAFGLLARMKGLRGTWLDIFGKTAERRMERQLIADYEKLLDEIMTKLDADNHALAVALAAIPEKIRGFGHVKERHLKAAKAEEAMLLDQFRAAPQPAKLAAE
ncbi:indolepyruvate ferredoxin oxidoreductase family protein [Terrarubrum flagellatum]|uniref:indolepyruvate ferredoxin oxidoreductase family protein n=1 Tax=Terrirubrum flagellatum TaxID=2895980 RepID=UPI00314506F6